MAGDLTPTTSGGGGLACRLCGSADLASFVDLGATPPCELFLTADDLGSPETTFPLHPRVCRECLLGQLPALIDPDATCTEYAYCSSFSASFVEHARRHVENVLDRTAPSFLVEVASNDGYLLQHVVGRGVRCLGVEPSVNVGEAARAKGVPTLTAFLSERSAASVRAEHGPADVVLANNVYAHIPDVADFTRGLRTLVADDGWVVIEVQHLLTLMRHRQFDTIYHEHFQYYTLHTAIRALAAGELQVADVEEIDTHGGSLRIWARPTAAGATASPAVEEVLAAEVKAGLDTVQGHTGFAREVAQIRNDLMRFLVSAAEEGRTVVGYGAPGKGNTLLNYCGIRPDLLAYTVDRNPYKHGRYTPGTRIPILPPERIDADRPDYVLVMIWNLREEIVTQLAHIGGWGGRFVFAIPHLEVVDPVRGGTS